MKRSERDFASAATQHTAIHLGALVRQARLARRWKQRDLAERARVSEATVKRIEAGQVAVSLGAWLSVFEYTGLLPLVGRLRDPVSAAVLAATGRQRARHVVRDDLDF